MIISAWFILIYIVSNIARELFQLYQQTWTYLLDPTNIVHVLLYISTTALVVPVLFEYVIDFQISCASIAVFLSWFTLLLNLQRYVRYVGFYNSISRYLHLVLL